MTTATQHTKVSPESRFSAVVLYDGYCVLCNWFVRFVIRIDRAGVIGFAPLESEVARRSHTRIPEGVDSVVLVHGLDVLTKADAVFRVFRLVGGGWRALRVFRVLPSGITNGVYDWIAKRRSRIFGRYDACPMPEPRYRDRFLD